MSLDKQGDEPPEQPETLPDTEIIIQRIDHCLQKIENQFLSENGHLPDLTSAQDLLKLGESLDTQTIVRQVFKSPPPSFENKEVTWRLLNRFLQRQPHILGSLGNAKGEFLDVLMGKCMTYNLRQELTERIGKVSYMRDSSATFPVEDLQRVLEELGKMQLACGKMRMMTGQEESIQRAMNNYINGQFMDAVSSLHGLLYAIFTAKMYSPDYDGLIRQLETNLKYLDL